MKTILITGVNGFLGSEIAKKLIGSFEVIGLEHPLSDLKRIKELNIKVYSSDNIVDTIFSEKKVWAVLHVATLYRRSRNESLMSLIDTNVVLPVKLFELAERNGCELFINTDTFFNDPTNKYSYLQDYVLSKKQVIEWLKLIQDKCKLVNMKIFHMYGPNDAPNKFIPQIISFLKDNTKTIELSPGEQRRDFIYIDDVVTAFETVINRESQILSKFQEFEIGTSHSVSIREFVDLAKTLSGSTSELKFGAIDYRQGEIMESKADTSELSLLGWKPEFNLERGLQKILFPE